MVVGLGGKLESLCIRVSRFCLDDILRRKWREERRARIIDALVLGACA